jgi:hypothetical protein
MVFLMVDYTKGVFGMMEFLTENGFKKIIYKL